MITTEEIYFSIVKQSTIPYADIYYVYKKNDIFEINCISLRLSYNEKIINDSIQIMKDVEKREGFMFWKNSVEGKKFFSELILKIIIPGKSPLNIENTGNHNQINNK